MSECRKCCGAKSADARSLLSNFRSHHPSGPRMGGHALFEGDKEGQLLRVHCGGSLHGSRPPTTDR